MKIDSVILSCNNNPLYLDFWNPVSRIWKERFDIEPVLIFFGNKKNHNLSENYGRIIEFPTLTKFPEYLQALWARYWYPIQEPERIWMISDIDMIPISKNYFINNLHNTDPCSYVHLFANAKPIPSCYHVAYGSLYQRFLNIPPDFETSLSRVLDTVRGNTHMGMEYWGVDEAYAHLHLSRYAKTHSEFFKFFWRDTSRDRIDRSAWGYDVDRLMKDDCYIDCHSIRPYNENKEEIEKIINLIMSKEN